MSSYAFGIDLGTTNSCIAVKTKGQPAKVITLADGSNTLPSCVSYIDGKVIVGREAYQHRYDKKHTVYSSKRDIGSDKMYTVYANGDDKPPIKVTPVDVACEILKKLKHDAELLYGDGFIKDVTITVPAYFTMERRQATIEAAEKAGLHVISLINEPTAAAIAYTEGKSANENILVYDLGGGTFDVTLLKMLEPDKSLSGLFDDDIFNSPMAKVVSSAGDPYLGGDDFDHLAYDYAIRSKAEALSLNPKTFSSQVVPETMERAILAIEQNKKQTTQHSLSTFVDVLSEDTIEHISLPVTVDHYDAALKDIFKRTQTKVKECLVGYNISDIDKFILIGGSTRYQPLRDLVAKVYSMTKLYIELNPDEAVALGAAINSSILIGDTNMSVTDVLPQSIGIEVTSVIEGRQLEGRFLKLIPKNTPLPTSVRNVVTTEESMQTQARVPIYQGEDPLAGNNGHVSTMVLELEPSDDIKDIWVTMTIDASGMLHVTLESGSNAISATVENILRPTKKTQSPAEKLALRYRLMLKEFDDPEIIDQGTEILDLFVEGKAPFAEVRNFFSRIKSTNTKKLSEQIKDADDTASTAFFSRAVEADDNDADEEDDTEE